ncbi:MAG: serine hydrolase [Chloroflexi bacterium]|nr:serine hydrolase [Chloroflexota bacterium]
MKLRNPLFALVTFSLSVGLACSAITRVRPSPDGTGVEAPSAPNLPNILDPTESLPSQPSAPIATPFDPLTGNGETTRSLLVYDDLFTGVASAPVDESAFAMPENAAPPLHAFQGKLDLTGESVEGGFLPLRDDFGYNADAKWQHLPEISFEFIQSGSHLIPVEQGLVYTGHEHWNYMVAPGRAWQETGDQGFSRASFPFALIERNQNCVHNGLMTFLFNDTSVSNVRFQVTQETCMYYKFDMWGQLKGSYAPYQVKDASALAEAHFDWLAHRMPVKPISALAEDYPRARINVAAIPSGITPDDATVYGLSFNGMHYISQCNTRHGVYPYCVEIRLPSYSTAKSALAGIAYMRLGQLYDPNIGSLPVRDYIPQAGSDWDGVTLNHALDMSTGHYARPGYMFDEYYGLVSSQFIVAESHGEKIAHALSFPRAGVPGQLWVYHSTDTYIATQTMFEYLRKQGGGDLFDMLTNDIFIPLHFSRGSLVSLRTENSPTGRPFGSHGMFYTPDDIVKLGSFLISEAGVLNGGQILHPSLLADTMQKNPSDRGLPTTQYDHMYNNSFWAKDYFLPCNFTAVFMSGYGGISVVMLPNGVTYYMFSDNGEFIFDSAVNEAAKLEEVCK